MNFSKLCIVGMTSLDAPITMPSSDIEKRISPILTKFKMRPHIITELTGIIERRYWHEGTEPSDAATQVAQNLFTKINFDKNNIDLIINSSVSKDCIEPSVAAIVHGNLELKSECLNFDIGNACLAFLNSIEMAGALIEAGTIKHALIVNAESSRLPVETTIKILQDAQVDEITFRKNFATLTIGSGASAMILSSSDYYPQAPKVVGAVNLAASKHHNLCKGQRDSMQTDASGLLKAGLELALQTYQKACQTLDWSNKNFKSFIIHQVSEIHTQKLCEVLGIPKDKLYPIFQKYGNVGPASIPIALDKMINENTMQKGERLALLGIGSGLNCMMMELLWQ